MRKPSKYEVTLRDGKKIKFTCKRGKYPSGNDCYRITATINKKAFDKKFSERWQAERFIENFQSEEKAASIQQHHVTTTLSQEQINDASSALDKLPKETTLNDAVDFYLQHIPKKEISVKEAFEELIQDKERHRLRTRSINEYKVAMRVFVKRHGHRLVSNISEEILQTYIRKKKTSAQTQNNARRLYLAFFNFCIKKKWCSRNPAEAFSIIKIDWDSAAILTIAEAKKLTSLAKKEEEGKLLPYITLCLFCGIRPAETERLTWNMIKMGDDPCIRLEASIAKKRKMRIAVIPENALTLLKNCQNLPVFPKNFRKMFDRLKSKAGIQWKNDIMRHSFGSYYLALTNSENKTADTMGNSADVIQSHYRALATKKEAEEFFNIT